MESVIHGLSNEEYHYGERFRDYLSSSQIKKLAISPKAFRYALDHPDPQTDAKRLGSLFHDLMACSAEHYDNGTEAVAQWLRGIAVFEPPVNEKTGAPYGTATKAYKEAYEAFLQANEGKTIASRDEISVINQMHKSLLCDSGATSEQVRKLLKWGKPEVSHFIEYEGCKFKWRPDLETKKKIIDYKTVATDDLSEKSINGIIAKYGYDISAAFYRFMEHEQSGVWKTFYWLFVTKNPPCDAILVDASKWTYDYDPELDIVMPQVGAIKMKRLLDLYIKCKKENNYPGSEIFIPADNYGRRIMVANPPAWEVNNAANILEQTFNEYGRNSFKKDV